MRGATAPKSVFPQVDRSFIYFVKNSHANKALAQTFSFVWRREIIFTSRRSAWRQTGLSSDANFMRSVVTELGGIDTFSTIVAIVYLTSGQVLRYYFLC